MKVSNFATKIGRRENRKSKQFILFPNSDIIDLSLDREASKKEKPLLNKISSFFTENNEANSLIASKKMNDFGWLSRESASDLGNFRFYPKGAIVYMLISRWLETIAISKVGAMPVITPDIYKVNKKEILVETKNFVDELYYVFNPNDNKRMLLEPGGDYGSFFLAKSINISYKDLPLRLFELAKTYRYVPSGELRNIEKARSFTMPEIHGLCCNNDNDLLSEYSYYYNNSSLLLRSLGIDYVSEFDIAEESFMSNKKNICEIISQDNNPIILNLIPKQKKYFFMKNYFIVSNNLRVFNLQADRENGVLFNINYKNNSGKKEPVFICHYSLASVERWMLIFVNAALKKNTPSLPLWVSPVQARIIPVAADDIPFSVAFLEKVSKEKIRIDLDDRNNKSVGDKVKTAEKDWIPFIIILGKKEIRSGEVHMRLRDKTQVRIPMDKVAKTINSLIQEEHAYVDLPYLPLPNRFLSEDLIIKP